MDKIRSLRFFVAALDGGSFAAAAKLFGTNPSTVSKAIGRLEKELGIPLFLRSTRQLSMTPAGREYAATARRLLEELTTCEERLKSQNDMPEGRLRLNVPVSYGRLYIRPMLKAFCRRYPGIEIDISFDDGYIDIIEQGVDIAIRSGSVQDSQLIVRQLSPIDFIVCAGKTFLERQSPPAGPEQFIHYPWIRFRYKQTGKLLPVMAPGVDGPVESDPGRQFVVNDGEAMAELCAEGMGLTQLPHFIARKWLMSGELVQLGHSMRQPGAGVYLLYAKRENLPARVRVFIEFVRESLEAQGETPHSTWAR